MSFWKNLFGAKEQSKPKPTDSAKSPQSLKDVFDTAEFFKLEKEGLPVECEFGFRYIVHGGVKVFVAGAKDAVENGRKSPSIATSAAGKTPVGSGNAYSLPQAQRRPETILPIAVKPPPVPVQPPLKQEAAESRVYSGTSGVEAFYAKMSSDLIQVHGPLKEVEYVSHYPSFEIRFHYQDGTRIVSSKRTGKFDIHFLSLGYLGEGPRYAKAFLNAAGFPLSSKEIEQIKTGNVIRPGDSKPTRLTEARPMATDSLPVPTLTVAQAPIEGARLHPKSTMAKSPDENFLAFIATNKEGSMCLVLFST